MDGSSEKEYDPLHKLVFIDYCINEPFGRFPPYFPTLYPNIAPMAAELIDPEGNVHSVQLERIGANLYFTKGWHRFGQFYGITEGAWVQLYFIEPGRFNFSIMDYNGISWIYPPMADAIDWDMNLFPSSQTEFPPQMVLANHHSFIATFVKWVSFSEYTGDVMTIPSTWAALYLRPPEDRVWIIDEYGKRWPCVIQRGHGTQDDVTIITRGWARFCRMKKIQQMQMIKFAVTRKNAHELHFLPQV